MRAAFSTVLELVGLVCLVAVGGIAAGWIGAGLVVLAVVCLVGGFWLGDE